MKRIKILNAYIDNIDLKDLLFNLKRGGFVVTPNVDHLIKLQHDVELYQAYCNADYTVCDSKILLWVSHFLGAPLRQKISGSDLFPAFYNFYKDDPSIKIFLLGSPPGIADQARQQINAKVGRTMVVDAYSPPFNFEHDIEECQRIIERINRSGATVLGVGLGAPKQEKWIYRYRGRLSHVKIFMGIGATIDFEAGFRKRAPYWISEAGLEWLFRLLSEPQRLWKRYLVDSLPFIWLILQQRLGQYYYREPLILTLQNAGLLSANQVTIALEEQRRNPELDFEAMILRRKWLKRETLQFFSMQRLQDIQKSRKQPIGQYLKMAGLMTDAQINEILKEQMRTNLLFGEIASSRGWIKQQTIAFFLDQTILLKSLEVEQMKPLDGVALGILNSS